MSAPATSHRKCLNNPVSFCYICGSHTTPIQSANISAFVEQTYFEYFTANFGDQDKPWTPHKVCKQCVGSLWIWTKRIRGELAFGIPLVWREQKDHCTDCYFCLVKTSEFNKKNKSKIEYPNLMPAIRPMPHSDEIPVRVLEQLPPWEDLSDVEERSGSNDEDFEIDEDSVRRGFN